MNVMAHDGFGEKNDTNHEFNRFRAFLSERSGISLSDNKNYLVESRLRGILQEQGLPSINHLLNFIENHADAALTDKVVDAMTTNETFWFRDSPFYDYLASQLLPVLLEKTPANHSIDIWSAASSSGQEAYSLSILVEQCVDVFKARHQFVSTVNILGTDISRQMISQAQSATYSQLELSRGLSDSIFRQYFDKKEGDKAKVKDSIRQRVKFRVHNLKESFSGMGPFDMILCRNVLIYFDDVTITDILRRLHAVLKTNGVLFLSSSESVKNLDKLYAVESAAHGYLYRAIK